MLLLTRKVGESIVIGGTVEVKVVAVSNHGRVKLGFDAPDSVRIWRSEIHERRQPVDEAFAVWKGGAR